MAVGTWRGRLERGRFQARSLAYGKARSKALWKPRAAYALLRGLDVVFEAAVAELASLGVVDHVRRTRVAVARLADGTDVNKVLAPHGQREVLRVDAEDAVHRLLVDHRAVRVAVEAYRRKLPEEVGLGLEVVEHVPEVLGPVHRRMDEGHAHLRVRKRQVLEPADLVVRQVLASPLDHRRGSGVEVVEVLLRRNIVVVVPDNDGAAERADDLHALVRAGVVADDIAGAQEVGNALGAAVVENDVQGVQVGVYVAEYGYKS